MGAGDSRQCGSDRWLVAMSDVGGMQVSVGAATFHNCPRLELPRGSLGLLVGQNSYKGGGFGWAFLVCVWVAVSRVFCVKVLRLGMVELSPVSTASFITMEGAYGHRIGYAKGATVHCG